MARKVETIVIEAEGRDKGKVFQITEMPAIQASKWATRIVWLVQQGGQPVPEMDKEQSVLALASISPGIVQMLALQDDIVSAQTWECVKYIHSAEQMPQKINQGVNSQIDEMATVALLQGAVLNLHIGFFSVEKPSTSGLPSLKTPPG